METNDKNVEYNNKLVISIMVFSCTFAILTGTIMAITRIMTKSIAADVKKSELALKHDSIKLKILQIQHEKNISR